MRPFGSRPAVVSARATPLSGRVHLGLILLVAGAMLLPTGWLAGAPSAAGSAFSTAAPHPGSTSTALPVSERSVGPSSLAPSVADTPTEPKGQSLSSPSAPPMSSPTTNLLSPLAHNPAQRGEIALPDGEFAQAIPRAGGPLGTGDPLTYLQAASVLTTVVAGFDGEQWSIVFAEGIAAPSPLGIATSNLTEEVNCTTWVGTPSSEIYVPATPVSAPLGNSNFYFAVFLSSGGTPPLLFAEVVNGTASLLFTLSGGIGCYSPMLLTMAPVPTDILDSSQAMALLDASGESAYLSQFPGSLREWFVEDYGAEPLWNFYEGAPCGAEFWGEVDAWDGSLYADVTDACYYNLTFVATGLPAGTDWSIAMTTQQNGRTIYYDGSGTGLTVPFSVPNGSYSFTASAYGYSALPASGILSVAGVNVTETIAFTLRPGFYTVSFVASGLTAAEPWWNVEILTTVETSYSTNDTISFVLPNGSYSYEVSAYGYRATPSTGEVQVDGGPVSVSIVLTPIPISVLVMFVETGLPEEYQGQLVFWSVTVTASNGSTESAGGLLNTAELGLYSGNYTFTISSGSSDFVPSPATGTFIVRNASVAISVAFSVKPGVYTVAFNGTGLPSNSSFPVALVSGIGPLLMPDGESLFYVTNGSYNYAIGSVTGFVATPWAGTVTVSGGSVEVTISFAPVSDYLVTFSETGLPAGSSWNSFWYVSFGVRDASSYGTSTLAFYVPNGSYGFLVGSYVANMSATPSNGTLTVNGSDVVQAVVFSLIPAYYTVVFTESGLPVGTFWEVVLNGTAERTTDEVTTFDLPDGSYAYLVIGPSGHRISNRAPSGALTVDGSDLNESFVFVRGATYSIAFSRSGLPKNESWCVTLQGWNRCTGKASLRFGNLTSGSYSYVVSPMSGQLISARMNGAAIPLTGTLGVATKGLSVSLQFEYRYAIEFSEVGLPTGTNWSITLKGVTRWSTNGTIWFSEPNGTYGYKIGPEANYRHIGTPSVVKVKGGDFFVVVTFTARAGLLPGPPVVPALARSRS